jgi:23S rRNA pseudouridine1911/1915/1917 synthase
MSEPVTRFLVGPRDGGKRLDHFLKEKIPGLSRSRIQAAIGERVSVSWQLAARCSTRVQPGGEVRVGTTDLCEPALALHLPVIARGPGWLAVDKPPGLPVHPVNGVRDNSLIRLLRRQERCEELRLVHRLDRETSGVLLVAEEAEAARELSRAFRASRVHKEYLALVAGLVARDEGQIDLPIGDALDSRVYVRRAVQPAGQPARTGYRVERRLADSTLLRLFPESGRRHQIRVHLAAIGHPILGDILYGGGDEDYLRLVRDGHDARAARGEPARQLLHCARIVLATRARGCVGAEAGLPEDFLSHLRQARASG